MLGPTATEDSSPAGSGSTGSTHFPRAKRRSRAKVDNRKRAAYVQQACNSCKARKTRCNGRMPCDHCGSRSLRCRYGNIATVDRDGEADQQPESIGTPTSEKPKPIGLNELTELVSALQRKVALLEREKRDPAGEQNHDPIHCQPDDEDRDSDSHKASAGSPVFAGPTSSNFSLGMAKIILEQDDSANTAQPGSETELASSASCWEEQEVDELEDPSQEVMAANGNQMYGLDLRDALRLLQIYQECIGVLHPIVDVDSLVQQCKMAWQPTYNLASDQPSTLGFAEDQAHLKMILAIALLAEGGGSDAIATKIYSDLQLAISHQMLAKNFTMRGQILLILAAFYQVFQDDNRLASRYVAITCRLMIEAGLHQRHVILQRFVRSCDRTRILTILSTCLILDRQLNFNAGLPFTLKDTDVDIPEMDTLPPYVKAMLAYARIGPPAWAAIADDRGRLRPRIRDEDFDYLDYQVRCWQDNLSTELRPDPIQGPGLGVSGGLETSRDRGMQFLRYILYLRANQFKIVILRPLLFTAHTVRANLKRVQALSHIANDTIETITEMNASYDLYRKQQPLLNVFLSSALSTLFLIYIRGLKGRATNTQELSCSGAIAREGINKSLKIIQAYSTSRSSQRLWKKLAGEHGLLSLLGFTPQGSDGSALTISVHSTSSPTVPSNLEGGPSSMPWIPATLAGYPGLDGFDMINNSGIQSSLGFDDLSPLPILGTSPFLVSRDGNFLYDDVW